LKKKTLKKNTIEESTTTPSEVQNTATISDCISLMPTTYQHLQANAENTKEYDMDNARVLAKMICHAN